MKILLIIILVLSYLGLGIFGAMMITRFWVDTRLAQKLERGYNYSELELEEARKETKREITGRDNLLLTVCQSLSILFGPVVPVILITSITVLVAISWIIDLAEWIKK